MRIPDWGVRIPERGVRILVAHLLRMSVIITFQTNRETMRRVQVVKVRGYNRAWLGSDRGPRILFEADESAYRFTLIVSHV